MAKQRRLILSFVLVVLLSGCKREEATDSSVSALAKPSSRGEVMQTSSETVKAMGQTSSDSSPAAAPPIAAQPSRMVVYTGDMQLIVKDTGAAVRAIQEVVIANGGYLGESRMWREGEVFRASITLRIPPERLRVVLDQIRSQAKRVEHENLSANDVGSEYVDLQSRLRNLRATETELRALLSTIRERSRKASEVLEIHQHLTAVRGEIEQLEGRAQHLARTVALATVRVELVPDAIGTPVVVGGWEPVATFRNASRALILLLQRGADIMIWSLIYILPAVLLLLLPVGFVVFVARRVRSPRVRST